MVAFIFAIYLFIFSSDFIVLVLFFFHTHELLLLIVSFRIESANVNEKSSIEMK